MEETVILIAEDDTGHFELVKRNLWRSCVDNEIIHFKDGQAILDFLFQTGNGIKRKEKHRYLLLLDIRMPKVDGREVLLRLKENAELRKMPVIMVTTTDESAEIDRCYKLGCSFYMAKPADYNKFMQAVENLGAFLSLKGVIVPEIKGESKKDAVLDKK